MKIGYPKTYFNNAPDDDEEEGDRQLLLSHSLTDEQIDHVHDLGGDYSEEDIDEIVYINLSIDEMLSITEYLRTLGFTEKI